MAGKNSHDHDSIKAMSDEIRMLYHADHAKAETLIENYVESQILDRSPSEGMELLMKLSHQFKSRNTGKETAISLESREFSRLFSLLLGKEILRADLSSGELIEKLAKSLHTLFDTINTIIRVIHTCLFGENAKFETIRHIIGSNLEKEEGTESLQSYLDQIKKAFLVSHKAFQHAVKAKVKQMLDELDPDRISESNKGGLKFGALRRAELFDIYKDKFQDCKGWFDSGRFTEELLREFEKDCQKLYKTEKRGTP